MSFDQLPDLPWIGEWRRYSASRESRCAQSNGPRIGPQRSEPRIASQKNEPAIAPQSSEPGIGPQQNEPRIGPQPGVVVVVPKHSESTIGPVGPIGTEPVMDAPLVIREQGGILLVEHPHRSDKNQQGPY
jgi:hypothetical protein